MIAGKATRRAIRLLVIPLQLVLNSGVERRAGVLYVGSQGGRSSVVEHLLPKQNVVGSIPIARSNFRGQLLGKYGS